MTYLLDSNACIAIINKKASRRFEIALDRAIRLGDGLYVPSIGVHELLQLFHFGFSPLQPAQSSRFHLRGLFFGKVSSVERAAQQLGIVRVGERILGLLQLGSRKHTRFYLTAKELQIGLGMAELPLAGGLRPQ